MLEALKWFVEHDDTNIGQPGNEFFEAGLNRGIAAIAAGEAELRREPVAYLNFCKDKLENIPLFTREEIK
jgi:hypothetical protein